MDLQSALAYLATTCGPSVDPEFLAACNAVAQDIADLPYQIFIQLPGGMSGNQDPAWDQVRAASHETCGCGIERFFEPAEMRHEYEMSDCEPVIMHVGDTIYLKPVGASNQSAYTRLRLDGQDGRVPGTFGSDPAVQNVFCPNPDIPAYEIGVLAEGLIKQQSPILLMRNLKSIDNVPVLGITAVDLEERTITIVPDAALEAFTLERAASA